jgi:hypothetical protein
MKIKSVDRLDAHDRLGHLQKQSINISECCQDLINQRPFGDIPFYIFAHARTLEDGATKMLYWQPRLTKPSAQENSMLFKAYPGSDNIKIIWMIPARELWSQYKKGNVTESSIVRESIENYMKKREMLEQPEEDDLSDFEIDRIYRDLAKQAHKKNKPFQKII